MPEVYSRAILKMVIAQICQMIGWHSINSTPLEFLVDLMEEYLLRISKVTKQYTEVLGRTEANLDDLGLAFQHMQVLIPELSEYVRNVDSVPCIFSVPKFPVCRENHLNFLKPGSQEVVTRSVHVHEHLPAMYQNTEDLCLIDKVEPPRSCQTAFGTSSALPLESTMATSPNGLSQSVFKRPGGLLPSEHSSLTKRSKIIEEGRALREIHSVIMTTSGFLSPAREGKLPEPRTPHQARTDSPPASSYPMVPPELKSEKKPKKVVKKGPDDRKLDKENKKKNRVKELFKPDIITDTKPKKLTSAKEHTKLQPSKSGSGKGHISSPGSANRPASPQLSAHKESSAKTPKMSQSKIKPERIQEVTSIATLPEEKEDNVDKLPSEPDKQKLNIFKKISKPREEKSGDGPESLKYRELNSRESSPSLVIDDISDKYVQRSDIDTKRDDKKTPKTPEVQMDEGGEPTDGEIPSPDVYIFGDMSPPGTPSTPKTPELEVPVLVDLKKKKKERNIRKKEPRSKSPKRSVSPKKGKNAADVQESQLCDRPRTPQAVEAESHKESINPPTLPFPFFPSFPSAPGLIPHPMVHPIFPRYPLALGRNVPGTHPAMPNLPMPPRFLTSNIRPDDYSPPKTKITDRDKVPTSSVEDIISTQVEPETFVKPLTEKISKTIKTEKDISQQVTASTMVQNDTIFPAISTASIASVSTVARLMTKNEKLEKLEKLDKNNKKSKDHKKERKDKFKKKKDKKEKHKIKDKSKGKKGKLTKLKDKKERKDKRKDKEKDENAAEAVPKITLKLGPISPRPPTPDNTTMKKITIKPLIKKPEEQKKRDPSPELAKISALVTRPPKQKLTKLKTDTVPKKNDGIDDQEDGKNILASHPISVDQTNRQVWICPACGNQDDGSPMIGCDDCDAWYHWVCVGVQVPPADHEDWYCRLCIAKKQELHHDKKKKKRKKKVKTIA